MGVDRRTWKIMILLVTLASLALATVSGQFNCPKKDGTFEDTRQCDKYYECFDGMGEERLCPDGLVFDPFSNKREPCDHYFNVDCGDRLELQTPRGPNDLCPRLNGFYAHPDFGSTNSVVSATGLLRQRERVVQPNTKFQRTASNALKPLCLKVTASACLTHIPNMLILLTVPNSTFA